MPQLEPLVDDGEQVWVGGPVQPNAVLVLGEFVDPDEAAVPLFGSLGFPALDEPDEVVPVTTRRRVFAGYAGWEAGQLESELERDDWIVEPALADDAFTEAPRGPLGRRPAPQGRRLRARRAHARRSVGQLSRSCKPRYSSVMYGSRIGCSACARSRARAPRRRRARRAARRR